MNYDDGTWTDHRDELFERVVHQGRTRKRRRGLGVAVALCTVVLLIGAGLYFPGRSGRVLHVANPVNGTTTSPAGSDNAAITYAYEHFFDPALTADERAALIQGGDELRAFIDEAFAAHAAEAAAGAIVVDQITVHGSTADVSFRAQYQGRESPVNPGQLSGAAVLEDGTWKISRATYCTLSANDGEPCPAQFEEALSDLGVNLDSAPRAVRNLASLEFCGSEQFQGFSEPQSGQLNERACRCFLDRYASGRSAVFVMAQTSVEGDPIVTIYRSTTEGQVEVFVDATRDSFGSGKWEYQTCGGVTTEFPDAPSPLPTSYFDGQDCGPSEP